MISHTSDNLTIHLPDNTSKILGNNLVLIDPVQIKRVFKVLLSSFPVKESQLPKELKTVKIKSETIPETCAVCSQSAFDSFISHLKKEIDLITINTFLAENRFKAHFFKI